MDKEIQGFTNTGIQCYIDTKINDYMDTGIRGYMNWYIIIIDTFDIFIIFMIYLFSTIIYKRYSCINNTWAHIARKGEVMMVGEGRGARTMSRTPRICI